MNDGWQLFNVQEEYNRQFQLAGATSRLFALLCAARSLIGLYHLGVCVTGVSVGAGKLGKRWRLSDINKRYTRAPTYPEYIGTGHGFVKALASQGSVLTLVRRGAPQVCRCRCSTKF